MEGQISAAECHQQRIMKDRVAVYNIRERDAVYRMIRTGPRTDPCGIPQLMVTVAELQLFTATVCVLFVM